MGALLVPQSFPIQKSLQKGTQQRSKRGRPEENHTVDLPVQKAVPQAHMRRNEPALVGHRMSWGKGPCNTSEKHSRLGSGQLLGS